MKKSRLDRKIKFGILWSEVFNRFKGCINIAKQKSLLKDKSLIV